jgi:hypothetical protein
MIDTLEKILPFLDRYPFWLRATVGFWVLATAVLAVLLMLIPRAPLGATPTTKESAISIITDSEPPATNRQAVPSLSSPGSSPTPERTISRGKADLPQRPSEKEESSASSVGASQATTKPSLADQSASTIIQITDTTGEIFLLKEPEVGYPSTFGPSREKGINVRRGASQAFLPWTRVRSLAFSGRKEKNDKGVEVWHYDVTVELTDGASSVVTLVDDWNMAYMGGGGTGLLFGRNDLGESAVKFSDIREVKVLRAGEPPAHR